jgi:serine/threonine-protein kinase
MADDLLPRLQAALGSSYRLERELGGGGMSRVFLAEETALGRQVVIKVLPPDYAAVLSIDRFRREIQLASRLQHPHIVPLLTAGEAGGTLYYTMPFVDGESLRARLNRKEPLPTAEVVRLLGEIADALAYAHEHGVVHRDIKPENILLSGQHAVVTDFGIAKALGSISGGGTLTSAGLSMGTPAYMAPEQIAADPNIDHRADLYAFGVLGYEMLTGRAPFAGRTPQELLAAHLTERPADVTRGRPDCPPALAGLLMQCLEKDREVRPTSAAEVRQRLNALSSGAFTPVPKRRSRMLGLGVAALIVTVLITGYFAGLWPGRSLVAQGLLDARDPVLLADISNHTRDSTLGVAAGEALRVDLTQSRTVTVFSSAQINAALTRMQRPADTPIDPALAREIAQREGVKAVITGDIASVGPAFTFSAQIVSAESGEPLAAFREVAHDSTELIETIGKVSHELRRKIGESLKNIGAGQPLEEVTTPSLVALRKYSQAIRIAATEGSSSRADQLLEEAVALDTGFAMAWRRLGVNYGNVGDRARQRHAMKTALLHQDRLTERERYLTLGTYYTRVDVQPQKARAAYEALLDLEPDNMPALNNMGLVYARLKDPQKANEYYRRAIAADSGSSTAWFNLVQGFITSGQPDSATSLLREASRRFPEYSGTPWIAAEVAVSKEQYDTAQAIFSAIRTSPASTPDDRGSATDRLAHLHLVAGRLGEARALLAENVRAAAQGGAPSHALDTEVLNAGVSGWFLGDRAGALRILDEALRRYPIAQLDTVDRPYLDVAYLETLTGRPDRARATLHEFEQLPLEIRGRSEGFRLGVVGMIALADGNKQDAVRQLQAAVARDPCERCALPDLARVWDAVGEPDSAIAAYEKYLATPMEDPLDIDAFFLAFAHRRLGELYEQRGDRDKAALHLQQFIELWKNADPVLQPQVAEAKKRLAGLVGEGRN